MLRVRKRLFLFSESNRKTKRLILNYYSISIHIMYATLNLVVVCILTCKIESVMKIVCNRVSNVNNLNNVFSSFRKHN